MIPCLAVLQKEQSSCGYMYSKDQKQSCAKNRNNQGMTVQLISVGLKECNGVKKGCIPGSMSAEKKNQETAGACHDPFFANGRFEKTYKPHKIEPPVEGTSKFI